MGRLLIYPMSSLSLKVFYLWRHELSTSPPFILWWSNLEILFAPLHRSSPFIGGLRCQAIQTEHGPYIAERTQKQSILWGVYGRLPLHGFYLWRHVLSTAPLYIYIMLVKIWNTIWPPPPQISLHRRAALTTNSNGTQAAQKGGRSRSSSHVYGCGFSWSVGAQTSHNIDCALGPLCYMYKSVFHLNCLTAQLSYEGRDAVEGGK
jgi:hypothetical protein